MFGERCTFNERGRAAYRENIANLLDYRVTLPAHDAVFGDRLLAITDRLYAAMQADDRGEPAAGDAAVAALHEAAAVAGRFSPVTAAGLTSLAAVLAGSDPGASLGAFEAHFGRGQQYVSFIAPDAAGKAAG